MKKSLETQTSKALSLIEKNNFLPTNKKTKIAVAMSGGVDSSVSIALLKELGYQVFGLTGWLLDGEGKCCQGGVIDAAEVCEQLGVEHEAQDLREIFHSQIINPFLSSYSQGKTPVPCMPCNTEVKWGSMLNYVKEKKVNYLASGHYARVLRTEQDLCIGRSLDSEKDQSYMLWGLNQSQLNSVIFPLANLKKEEIRAISRELNLVVSEKAESQDLCFVPQGNRAYLLEKLGAKPGQIRHFRTNKLLGEHQGAYLYTLGQRKGLGVAYPEPLYVIKLDITTNTVLVGEREFLYSQEVLVQGANWQDSTLPEQFEALVKIRYNSPALRAKIRKISGENENKFEATFEEGVLSVTPGQAGVVYDLLDKRVLGGGWIELARK